MPSAACSALTLESALRTAAEEDARSCATAPPAAKVSVAAATSAPARRRRPRLRVLRASARRARERRLDSSHGTWFDGSALGTAVNPLVPGAYGVSCRARARTCATPCDDGDSPRGAAMRPRVVPPFPGGANRRGLGKVFGLWSAAP